MNVSCWQHHFLWLRSVHARQTGYAEALGGFLHSAVLKVQFQSRVLEFATDVNVL